MDQERKKYFEAVFIGDQAWGPIRIEDALKAKPAMFPCGHCSIEGHRVFHSLFGAHCHISKEQLLERIENAPFEKN